MAHVHRPKRTSRARPRTSQVPGRARDVRGRAFWWRTCAIYSMVVQFGSPIFIWFSKYTLKCGVYHTFFFRNFAIVNIVEFSTTKNDYIVIFIVKICKKYSTIFSNLVRCFLSSFLIFFNELWDRNYNKLQLNLPACQCDSLPANLCQFSTDFRSGTSKMTSQNPKFCSALPGRELF